jgi:hypothetical protein
MAIETQGQDPYFDVHYGRVCTAVWETWTHNGLNLGPDEDHETMCSVQDAVTNTYVEGINDTEWWKAALARLGVTGWPVEG